MKTFKYICAMLIFAIAFASLYFCIGITSISYYCFIGLMVLCGIIVLCDGFQGETLEKN